MILLTIVDLIALIDPLNTMIQRFFVNTTTELRLYDEHPCCAMLPLRRFLGCESVEFESMRDVRVGFYVFSSTSAAFA